MVASAKGKYDLIRFKIIFKIVDIIEYYLSSFIY